MYSIKSSNIHQHFWLNDKWYRKIYKGSKRHVDKSRMTMNWQGLQTMTSYCVLMNWNKLARSFGLHFDSQLLLYFFKEKWMQNYEVTLCVCISCSVVSESLWTVAHQAPLSVEFSRQEYWSGLPSPSPRDLPDPGIKPGSPALQAESLPSEPPEKT